MDSTQIKEGAQVRIAEGTTAIPEGWWGRTATVVEVEETPANPGVGLQAQIRFSSGGGLQPIVPVACLETA